MELILPDTYEEIKTELKGQVEKMMDFVVSVKESEQEITLIAQNIRTSGKLALMYGIPGIGKSTFVQSLKWQAHMQIKEVINIDASDLCADTSRLAQLIEKIKAVVKNTDINVNNKKNGIVTIVIDYLESLEDETPESKKSFFRDLNGILRKNPILIIWPITEKEDVKDIIGFSKAVSGTLFVRGHEVIEFTGPKKEEFPMIMKNTIAVLNPGHIYSDYQFSEGEFEELLSNKEKTGEEFTLRDYIADVRQLWHEKTYWINKIISTSAKRTEVWFIFSMPEAEQVVAQFVRKSVNIEECWNAYHAKLEEYIQGNQKAQYWNSQRLQLAISGAFTTKIMHLPTNALVSCLAAYGKKYDLDKKIDWNKTEINPKWKQPSTAKRFLKNTPMIKQLLDEPTSFGASRGRSTSSVEDARKAFEQVNKLATANNPQNTGSDKPINKALVDAIKDIIPNITIKPEKEHPWLKNIYPDIQIELEDKIICLEFHYTKKSAPYAVADYVLKKMDIYMRQIESKYPNLFQ